MTILPPASYSSPQKVTSKVSSWLEQLPSSPSADGVHWPLKRKRASPEPTAVYQFITSTTHCKVSPRKCQWRDKDESLPEQSVSTVGSNAYPLILGNSTTLSPPGSRVSASAPQRKTISSREAIAELRIALPPIITGPLDGVKQEPPAWVMAVVARLEDGLDQGWIPGWLEEAVKFDVDAGFQRFKPAAFSKTTTRDLSDPDLSPAIRSELEFTLMEVKKISKSATHCQTRGRDKIWWCNDVVRPMIMLALRLYAKGKLSLQEVQPQSLDIEFLSHTADASSRQRVFDPKTDYTLSYSHDASHFQKLYASILQSGKERVSHTTDTFTKIITVFSGIEVKSSDGDKLEAEYQLSIWMAATLRKKAKLGLHAGLIDTNCLVEPGFTVVGHNMYFYIAYMDTKEGEAVHILEFGNSATNSVSGVFKQLKMWRNVIEYSLDEEPGGFLGGFLKPVLEGLAISKDQDTGNRFEL